MNTTMIKTMLADDAVEYVTKEWLARRAAHGTMQKIQDGGEGNGLLSRQYASYYKGARISTDGTTIYSYTTPLLTIDDEGAGGTTSIVSHPYYSGGRFSRTTANQIKIIQSVLTGRGLTITI